ncbi:hypothetical protein [Candidatus Soleaferrea massiliensis]|uniref:hypothetical protein n=1 Tax=Candidatus Soleaferrea massiliensis TaxID=1470354 RepID=UPI00058ED4CE|nr:hypothetical protein [Candidatus Soleaferrea massiliensis]
MKRKPLALLLTAALLSSGLGVSAIQPQQQTSIKLDAQTFTIVDESISHVDHTKRGGAILFDSQDELPETPEKANIKIAGKTWQPNYIIQWGQPSFYIDLGAYYVITDIGYMDMNGAPTVDVFYGEPFAWKMLGNLPTNYYNSYRVSHVDQGTPTRYLRVVSQSSDTGINEIGLYGYKVRELDDSDFIKTQPKPADSQPENLTSGQKIGANAFCDDPYTALAALGNVREYYNWSWMTGKDGAHSFNSIVNKDRYYQTLQSMGVSVIPCMQMTCPAFQLEGEDFSKIKNTIPIADGADTLDPSSYALHSNAMYNFAARYGSNPDVDQATLNVADGDVQVGLGYLNTVESWNEQDKTWETKDSYFHPYEYAAMLSADYDGDEGRIQNGGVKTADENFKLAMGGLAGGSKATRYLSLMKNWFDHNRSDGQFACDVINYHDYITDEEAPERSNFREHARDIVEWTEQNAPGREVWLSEFDVIASDKQISGVDNHDNEAYAEARAQRLLRAFLVGEREGLDRMSMFMLRDEWSGVYYNSGLTTGKGDWDKKTSWYYVSAATETLQNADLVDVQESDDVYVYTYRDRSSSETIYAVWSPTADGSTVPDYQLSVGEHHKATLVTPAYGVKEGEKQFLPITSGTVSLDVTETPVFLKVSDEDVAFDHYPQQLIHVQQMRLGERNGSRDTVTFDNHEVINLANGETPSADNFMLNQFCHLFDEQNPETTAATPWVKTAQKPATEMAGPAVHKDRAYPYDCVLTFDDYYTITYVGIYDSYSTGKLEIYDDVSGDLIFTSALDSYNTWVLTPLTDESIRTNRIRIVKYDDAKLNELAFYGYPADRKIGVDVPSVPGEIGSPSTISHPRLAIADSRLGALSESYSGNHAPIERAFAALHDEQELLPETDRESISKASSFKSNFSNIWGSGSTFPFDAVVTLEERSAISCAAIYAGWGTNAGKFEIYNNETGELLVSDELIGNGKLFYFDFAEPVETQSLHIVKYNSRTICEIGFYGDSLSV